MFLKRYQNKTYLKWVKTLPCSLCHAPADDPHHIIGKGMGGMGTKAPDWAVMPVCRRCHQIIHESPITWDDQWEYVAKTLGKAIEDGII